MAQQNYCKPQYRHLHNNILLFTSNKQKSVWLFQLESDCFDLQSGTKKERRAIKTSNLSILPKIIILPEQNINLSISSTVHRCWGEFREIGSLEKYVQLSKDYFPSIPQTVIPQKSHSKQFLTSMFEQIKRGKTTLIELATIENNHFYSFYWFLFPRPSFCNEALNYRKLNFLGHTQSLRLPKLTVELQIFQIYSTLIITYFCYNMDRKDRHNPFTQTRIPLITTTPLLSYGDDEFSLFKHLSQNKRLYSSQLGHSDRETQQQILWRYQKQYYATDQQGRSYAEEAFNLKLQKENHQQDFWEKVGSQSRMLKKKNSYLFSDTSSIKSLSNFGTFSDSLTKTSQFKKPSTKSPREINRCEIIKIRKTLKQFKGSQSQQANKDTKFSVMNMYKAKKGQDSFQPMFTFAQLQVQMESSPKLHLQSTAKFNFQAEPSQAAQQYSQQPPSFPKSIFIGREEYYYIPLD